MTQGRFASFAINILLVLGSPCAASGQAQSGGIIAPLTIPRVDSLRCRSVPRSALTGSDTAAALAFEFLLGHDFIGDSRSITVLYSATGAPISLRENTVVTDSSNRIVIDGIVAEFLGETVQGFHSHGDDRVTRERNPRDSTRANYSSTVKPLDEDKKRSVRQLAEWLWTHRCGRGRQPGTQSW